MSKIVFTQEGSTPLHPSTGQTSMYVKTDEVLYIQDSSGTEIPLGSSAAITSLTGDVSATGPGVGVTTVNSVGGSSASDVHSAELAANAATASNTASTIVERDGSGNFSASTITANLSGNAATATTSVSFTGSLSGDVTGTQNATVVASVGGSTASNIHSAELAANAATNANTASTIVKRDSSGNFSAGTITANLTGAASANVLKTGDSMSGILNMTGNSIINLLDPVSSQSAATRNYVDNLAVGIIPMNPVLAANLLDDSLNTPPVSPVFNSSYIIGPAPTGAWVSIGAGHLACWNGSNWVDCLSRAVQVGDRFGVDFENIGTPGGGLAGKQNDIAQITANTPGFITYTYISPMYRWTVVDNNDFSLSFGTTYYYNATNWVEIATGFVPAEGTGVSINGVTINAIFDGTTIDINGNNQLEVKAGGINTTQLAANSVTNSKLATVAANTLKGNNTGSSMNPVDLTIPQVVSMFSGVPITQVPDQANSAGTTNTFARADHIHDIPSAVPVQIGISNMSGSAPSFALSDHIHSHGNQTVATLHAVATDSLNGFMSAADKTILDAATSSNTVSTLVERDSSGNFSAGTITANLTGNATTATTSTNFSGSLAGDITGTQSATNVAKVQGTVVSGTTGTGNVVFSASPTLTGTTTAAAISMSGALTSSSTSIDAIAINTNSFVVDATNNAIGLGIQPATNTILDSVNSTAASKTLQMTGYGVGSTVGTRGRFARGTTGSPSAAQNGDIINFWSARGYGTSQFAAASTAAINAIAGETFTNTSNLTYIALSTTPTGSVTSAEAMRVASTGVTLGPQSSSTALHQSNGGLIRTTKTITANYTVDTTTTDDVILCNHSGAITITLPTPTVGRTIVIKDRSGAASTNNITIAQHASETIEGLAASKVLSTNYGAWTFHASSAGNWWML